MKLKFFYITLLAFIMMFTGCSDNKNKNPISYKAEQERKSLRNINEQKQQEITLNPHYASFINSMLMRNGVFDEMSIEDIRKQLGPILEKNNFKSNEIAQILELINPKFNYSNSIYYWALIDTSSFDVLNSGRNQIRMQISQINRSSPVRTYDYLKRNNVISSIETLQGFLTNDRISSNEDLTFFLEEYKPYIDYLKLVNNDVPFDYYIYSPELLTNYLHLVQ